jgi:serine/threonine-protein kinase
LTQQVGKYQLVSKLATGGMAEVFLAKAAGPMGFEKTLVLKRILPQLAEDPQFIEMFLSEARLAAQLNHPSIVQIFDFGESEGAYYLAMEYIDGPNLRMLAKKAHQRGLELPPPLCAKIISIACDGLAFAHDAVAPDTGEPLHLIHRDVSPDNILVSRQGAVKVVDFGIAKAANQSHKTQAGMMKGKVSYMPPEQLQVQRLDRRVDVYALGVVLYELLTGHKPFEAATEVSIMQAVLHEPFVPATSRRPDLPKPLVQILDKAMAKAREQRYPDCRALQADLERYILSTGEPMGPWQLAQFIAQVTGEGSAKAESPSKLRPAPGTGSRPQQPTALLKAPPRGTPPPPAASSARKAPLPPPPEDDDDDMMTEPLPTEALSDEPDSEVSALVPVRSPRRTGLWVMLGCLLLLAVGAGVFFLRS